MPISEALIREKLRTLSDPYLGLNIVAANALKTLTIQNNQVSIALKFGYPLGNYSAQLNHTIFELLKPLVEEAKLTLSIDWKVNKHSTQASVKPVPGIKNIIAVASGKGGVGKSTTAINLALAIAAEGARAGILDADIYGPSQPVLLGVKEKPAVGKNKRLQPIIQYGLQTMSMGYLVAEETPMVWRGPMASSALQQLMYETMWDDLDYLIIDLPPGTGDIQLTLAQKIPVSGTVIVTTPQNIALFDAKKALMMFRKLDIAILGIIENMSTHICSQCGHQDPIFGSMGGEKLAAQFGVSLLGQLPLNTKIQAYSDKGMPTVIAEPTGDIAYLYREIARSMTAKLSLRPRDYSVLSSMRVLD